MPVGVLDANFGRRNDATPVKAGGCSRYSADPRGRQRPVCARGHRRAATTGIENEPAAKLIVDPPLSDALAHGRVILQYRAENMRLLPVFGQAALAVSPTIGHVHVTVDDNPWKWADASGEALIINGLPPGQHHILVELENANHQTVDKKVITFVIPASGVGAISHM